MKDLWNKREKYKERCILIEFQDDFYKLAIIFHRLGCLPISDLYKDLTSKLKTMGKGLMTLSSRRYFGKGLGDPFVWIAEVIDDYISQTDEILELIVEGEKNNQSKM